MEVFRLARRKFAEPLSGKGAALKGARWNSVGIELIYTAENRSLAMAEVAVHLSWSMLPDDYVMITIDVPDDIEPEMLAVDELPPDWGVFPHPDSVKKFGDDFVLRNESSVLQVPSAVTKGDLNWLINPAHPDFKRIRISGIEPFDFDKRLFHA